MEFDLNLYRITRRWVKTTHYYCRRDDQSEKK